jgi:hypothetical protein
MKVFFLVSILAAIVTGQTSQMSLAEIEERIRENEAKLEAIQHLKAYK